MDSSTHSWLNKKPSIEIIYEKCCSVQNTTKCLSEHKNTHFTFFHPQYHGNSSNWFVMVLVERFLVSFETIFYVNGYIWHGYIISRVVRYSNPNTRTQWNDFPFIPFSRFVQYKSKVMFHTVNSYSLVYIMCPIFKIDKLDWFGFQRRNIHFRYYIPL